MMTPAHAIIIGSALIGACVLFVNGPQSAVAMNGGPFQIMHHSNTAANAGVFRLDTGTGEVSYCYLSGTSGADLVCSRAVK
jgi:hypothetical protein